MQIRVHYTKGMNIPERCRSEHERCSGLRRRENRKQEKMFRAFVEDEVDCGVNVPDCGEHEVVSWGRCSGLRGT